MSKGEYDWRRVDENYTDVGYLARVPGSNDQQLPLSTPAVPSVFITNKFNVVGMTLPPMVYENPASFPFSLSFSSNCR